MRRVQQTETGDRVKTAVAENSLSGGLITVADATGNAVNNTYKSKSVRLVALGALIATGGIVSVAAGVWDGGRTVVSGTRAGLEDGIDRVTGGEGVTVNGPSVELGDETTGGQTFGVTPAGEAAAPVEASGSAIPQETLSLGAGAIIRFCGVEPNYDPAVLQSQWQPIAEANPGVFNTDVNNPSIDAGDQGFCL